MAGEQIPVVNENTGAEAFLPAESLEAWAERGWKPKEDNWREKYGYAVTPEGALVSVVDEQGNAPVAPADVPPATPQP